VYREIFLRMTENQEIRSIQDIFETFDTANKSFITLEEFKSALVTLGEGSIWCHLLSTPHTPHSSTSD
jgi:Ca2+-binding EF-hand superfamily protein